MSDVARGSEPSVVAEDVWVRFLIRYHRTEMTIREAFVRSLDVVRRRDGDKGWREAFWALRGLNIQAHPGEVVGIVGRNGCGKTTLLKTLAGILTPDRGSVKVRGRVGCLLSFGVGFNPMLSGRENVFLNGSILGLSRKEITQRYKDIVDFSELGDFIDAPVRTYSAGMKGRLGFSIAVHIDPDVLILDEVLSVGDAAFRNKAGSILNRYHSSGKTVVVASHSMDLIRKQCDRAYWIGKGRVIMEGKPAEITQAYVSQSILDGMEVDLDENLPAGERDEAKAFWRQREVVDATFSISPPDYVVSLTNLIAATSPQGVLEFGCGVGRILEVLRRKTQNAANLRGIDVNEPSIRAGAHRYGLELEVGDENTLKTIPDRSIDVVFTSSSLVHVPFLPPVLDELVRISRRYLILYEPCMPAHSGRVTAIRNQGRPTEVFPFTYMHDYSAYLKGRGLSQVYERFVPPKDGGIGPLYRLMVFATNGDASIEFERCIDTDD